MIDPPYNPNDPAFLLSRSLDESLTDGEKQKLRATLETSEEFRRLLAELRSVDSLVRHWGARKIEVDESSFVDGVLGRIADEHSDAFSEVDDVLRSWGERSVRVDEASFVAGVHRRVNESSRERVTSTWIYRIRRPVAVAAALGLVVTAALMYRVSQRPVAEVLIVRTHTSFSEGASSDVGESRVVVFDRSAIADSSMTRNSGRTALMVIGADADDEDVIDAPPL